ncbi:MAG TPA: hypothetical protein DCS07_06500 [Bdellovibrionales bacterium]|nr:MAG: hypothetical protein A2070_01725 [Bdellovibrionales bacterium GWC1_52_8]HAR42267.1 hypothetical protein [Bdellovibrionales bacterium]
MTFCQRPSLNQSERTTEMTFCQTHRIRAPACILVYARAKVLQGDILRYFVVKMSLGFFGLSVAVWHWSCVIND